MLHFHRLLLLQGRVWVQARQEPPPAALKVVNSPSRAEAEERLGKGDSGTPTGQGVR